MREYFLGTVVRGKDDDRVVSNLESVDGIQYLSDTMVHLGQHVGEVPIASLSFEIRMGKRGHVNLSEGHIHEEG